MRCSFAHELDRDGRARLLTAFAFGLALDTLSGFVTAPGAALVNWTPATGDSLAIRNCDAVKKIFLLDMWPFNQAAGILEVRSPRLHDAVHGIRSRVPGNSQAFPLTPNAFPQRVYPQDVLTVAQSGSAVGGQIETGSIFLWYEDLPGIAAKLVTSDEVNKRAVNILNQETVNAAGVAGGYSGQVALNSTIDQMIANTDYALIGALSDTQVASLCIRGADSGNLRCAVPGNTLLRDYTKKYFYTLSQETGYPCIPVFNSANKQGILTDVVNNQVAAVTVNITWCFVELAPKA